MEIIELVSFHLNKFEELLEVSFRTNSDNENVIRESKIPFYDISDFGFNFHLSEYDNIDENFSYDFEDEFEDDDLFVDENEILLFLNEYYILFIDKLPKPEII